MLSKRWYLYENSGVCIRTFSLFSSCIKTEGRIHDDPVVLKKAYELFGTFTCLDHIPGMQRPNTRVLLRELGVIGERDNQAPPLTMKTIGARLIGLKDGDPLKFAVWFRRYASFVDGVRYSSLMPARADELRHWVYCAVSSKVLPVDCVAKIVDYYLQWYSIFDARVFLGDDVLPCFQKLTSDNIPYVSYKAMRSWGSFVYDLDCD